MGLNQDDPSHPLRRGWPAWALPGLAVAIAGVLALTGDSGRLWLRFDRSGIGEGEIWRLLTCHFVHLGWSHLLLNAAGLLLIWYLVAARFRTTHWLLIAGVTIAGIDVGFWLFEPQLQWYVGLSGLLHGLLAAGVVGGARARQMDAWLLGAVLILKLAYEQVVGPIPGSTESTGGTVIVAAHLYGAITAGVAGALLPVRVERRPAI